MSEILTMARNDFLEVEALRSGIVTIRRQMWRRTEALLTLGNGLEEALAQVVIHDPKTGQPLPPRLMRKAARRLRDDCRRAADMPGMISAELAAAWTSFDLSFKRPAEQAAAPKPRRAPGDNAFRGLPQPGSARRAS